LDRAEPPAHERIRLLLEFSGRDAGADEVDVPDPYYGGPVGFEHVLDLIEEASAGLLREVLELSRRLRGA
jgi:protein-tyrosine phosphatase